MELLTIEAYGIRTLTNMPKITFAFLHFKYLRHLSSIFDSYFKLKINLLYLSQENDRNSKPLHYHQAVADQSPTTQRLLAITLPPPSPVFEVCRMVTGDHKSSETGVSGIIYNAVLMCFSPSHHQPTRLLRPSPAWGHEGHGHQRHHAHPHSRISVRGQ